MRAVSWFVKLVAKLRHEGEMHGQQTAAGFTVSESNYREAAGILEGLEAVRRGATHELELTPRFGPED